MRHEVRSACLTSLPGGCHPACLPIAGAFDVVGIPMEGQLSLLPESDRYGRHFFDREPRQAVGIPLSTGRFDVLPTAKALSIALKIWRLASVEDHAQPRASWSRAGRPTFLRTCSCRALRLKREGPCAKAPVLQCVLPLPESGGPVHSMIPRRGEPKRPEVPVHWAALAGSHRPAVEQRAGPIVSVG